MNFVYILYSEKFDIFYKGQTDDIEQRLIRHNAGLNQSTKHGVPWKLLWTVEKPNRSEAMILEKKLKNLSRDRTVQFMLKFSDGFASNEAKHLVSNVLLTKSQGDLSGC